MCEFPKPEIIPYCQYLLWLILRTYNRWCLTSV